MNRKIYESTYRGLSSPVRRVFDAVPILDFWTSSAIAEEIRRGGSGLFDGRSIMGTLRYLVELGMVKETKFPNKDSVFRRVLVKEKTPPLTFSEPKPETAMANTTFTAPEPQPEVTAAVLLADIAKQARTLADDIDAALLILAKEAQVTAADLEKFRQFKALLR
jgi:hypothetical protein